MQRSGNTYIHPREHREDVEAVLINLECHCVIDPFDEV